MLATKTEPFHGLTLGRNIFSLNEREKQQVACFRTDFGRILCSHGFLQQEKFCSASDMEVAFFCFGICKILFLLNPVTVLLLTSVHGKMASRVRGRIE